MAGAFEAFSGFIQAGVEAVSSVVSDLGSVFLTPGGPGIPTEAVSALDFGVPVDDLAGVGAYLEAGSLAGDATWFDTFNAGDIVNAAGSVASGGYGFPDVLEEGLGSLTDAAGSVASGGYGFPDVLEQPISITDAAASVPAGGYGFPDVLEQPVGPTLKSVAAQVKQDFTGFIKNAQGAVQAYQKVAPVVNAVSSALGIPNPVNQVLQPLGQAVGIAGAAAGIAGAVETGNVRAAVTNPALVSTTVGLIRGGGTLPIAQGIGTGVSLYNTVQAIGSRLPPVANATPVSGSTGYTVAGGLPLPRLYDSTIVNTTGEFRELTLAETQQLTRNATLINNFVDPGYPFPENYNTAKRTLETMAPQLIEYQRQVEAAQASIKLENENIANFEARLENPDLTDEQRARLEEERAISYDIIARDQQVIDDTQPLIASTEQQVDEAQNIVNTTLGIRNNTPDPVVIPQTLPENTAFYDPETGTWSIFNRFSGETIRTGLTEQQALELAPFLGSGSKMVAVATPVNPISDTTAAGADLGEIVITAPRPATDAEVTNAQNAVTAGLTEVARSQQAVRSLRNTQAQSSDWRVKLSLAPNSTYLYNDQQPGLLAPLKPTNGVIFPYTPSIETAYKANYDAYDLTHSNYRGYFYKNSYVDAVNLRATFTAQDTNEANYLLAVIHFFRSVTKMFYGQSTDQRGAPPPLVYIKGYGDFQFNNHPCLVSQFNYTLPPDVDYIRAQSVLSNNTNLQLARLRSTIANNPLSYSVNRLLNSQLLPGALDFRPSVTNNLGVGNPTYVPTKIEISVSLLPIQSRQQVSKNFSVGEFATGNLLKGGFW